MNSVVRTNATERTAVATPDVLGVGLVVSAVVTIASHLVVLDLALDLAGTHLGVDGEGLAGVGAPDLVDVVVPVGAEVGGLDVVVDGGREDSDGLARLVGDTHTSPVAAIGVLLGGHVGADLADSTADKTDSRLSGAILDLKLHAQDQTDEVDVADVGIDDVVGISEFDETPADAGARVLKVGNRRLDQTITVSSVDHEELEVASGEVDTTRAKSDGKNHVESLSLGRERNGEVLLDLNGDLGTLGARVDQLALGTNEDNVSIRV